MEVVDSSSEGDEGDLTGDLFDRYLERAEMLLQVASQRLDRWRHFRALGMVLATVVFLTTFLSVADGPFGLIPVLSKTLAGGLGMTILALVLKRLLLEPQLRQVHHDEAAMITAITLLRDLEPELAERERWDYVRRQITEARIARFPIGPRTPQ